MSNSASSESSNGDNIASVSCFQVDLGHAESLHNLMHFSLLERLAVSGYYLDHVSNGKLTLMNFTNQ